MPEKNEFLGHLRELNVKFSRFYARILTQADITFPQYALLIQLATAGPMTMTEISERLHISKPAVTNLVDRLEKKKCLKRLPDLKDRRIYLLKLEAKGEKIVRRIQGYVLNLLLKTFDEFNADERKTISRFYISLSETMNQVLLLPEGDRS